MEPRAEPAVYPRPANRRFDLQLAAAIASYERQLRAENKSEQTISRVYLPRLRGFTSWLADRGMPDTLEGLRREHVEAYIQHLQTEASGRRNASRVGQAPASVSIAYRTVRAFLNWAVREDLLRTSPMDRMRAPRVPEMAIAFVRESDFEKLLRACAGTGFEERRDTALLRLLYDTGARRGEVVGLLVEDLDWTYNTVVINAENSKSKRSRAVPFGRKCAAALDRYLRVRARHPYAEAPSLWLGKRGRVTGSGILQIVERRGRAAGLDGLHDSGRGPAIGPS